MADATAGKSNSKRNILIIVGSILGLFFLWLAFRDISLTDLADGVKQMKVLYLLPCLLLAMACQFVRALRFGVILSPFCSLRVRTLWDLLNIWAAANMIMPARLGELVRPYLLQQKGASFSSVFGAVIVERFFDLSGLLLLLGTVLWKTPKAPPKFSFLGEILLICLILGYILVLLILIKRDKALFVLRKIFSILPNKAATFMGGVSEKLIDGLGIMASPKQALIIFSYSIVLWLLFSTTTYLFMLAFSINAPFLVAVTIQVFIALGVALPSAPGFIGTFHAAGRYALALFGIGAIVAVSFATVYHLFSLVVSVGLGVISYIFSDFRLDQKIFSESVKNS
ncbi:MAG: lysylphosphatidylglycerol synthase transmembrane domain-containing protein [Deltaproteobacteria bacterium]|nr:lysylphosphatidylglycerol synthase transmembrane domain-containing protein [Deltaproteobacteria bacterium]